MVSHRSLLAAACAWEAAYSLRLPPLRHLQAAGFSFDVFTGDWVRALTTGGTLVACPRSVLLDPAALSGLIRRERIECLELVPAVADALATHLEQLAERVSTASGSWPSAQTRCAGGCTADSAGSWDLAAGWSIPTA